MRLVSTSVRIALALVLGTPVAAQMLPQVADNAALRALPSQQYPAVYRLGYATLGDGGAVLYRSSNAACALNGGNGDNGLQVRSLNGGCWIATGSDFDVRIWGADATGATDAAPALNAAAKAGVPLRVAKGTYAVNSNWWDITLPNQQITCENGAVITANRAGKSPAPLLIIEPSATHARITGCTWDHKGTQFLNTGTFVPLRADGVEQGTHNIYDGIASAVLIMGDYAEFAGNSERNGWDNCVGIGEYNLATGAPIPQTPTGARITLNESSGCGLGPVHIHTGPTGTNYYSAGAGVNCLQGVACIISDSIDRGSAAGFFVDVSGGGSANITNLTAIRNQVGNWVIDGDWHVTATLNGVAFYISGSARNWNGSGSANMVGVTASNLVAIAPQSVCLLLDHASYGNTVTGIRCSQPGMECVLVNGGIHSISNVYCDQANYWRGVVGPPSSDYVGPPAGSPAVPQVSAIQISANQHPYFSPTLWNPHAELSNIIVDHPNAATPKYGYAVAVSQAGTPNVGTLRIVSSVLKRGVYGKYYADGARRLGVDIEETLGQHFFPASQIYLPAVSFCGSPNGTVSSEANDFVGRVVEGTAASGCTLTFRTPFKEWPNCSVTGTNNNVPVTTYHVTDTQLIFTNPTADNAMFVYQCFPGQTN